MFDYVINDLTAVPISTSPEEGKSSNLFASENFHISVLLLHNSLQHKCFHFFQFKKQI